MSFASIALPSTTPALNFSSGLSLAYLVSAFARAIGSAGRVGDRRAAHQLLDYGFKSRALRRARRQRVLDDAVLCPRTANCPPQFVVIGNRQLAEFGHKAMLDAFQFSGELFYLFDLFCFRDSHC